MSRIEKLKALLEKATPAPWDVREFGHYYVGVYSEGGKTVAGVERLLRIPLIWDDYSPNTTGDADASLIAEMRNALPALLRVAEAALDYRSAHRDCSSDEAGDLARDVAHVELDAALDALEVDR